MREDGAYGNSEAVFNGSTGTWCGGAETAKLTGIGALEEPCACSPVPLLGVRSAKSDYVIGPPLPLTQLARTSASEPQRAVVTGRFEGTYS
jgi:hypothetical protein